MARVDILYAFYFPAKYHLFIADNGALILCLYKIPLKSEKLED